MTPQEAIDQINEFIIQNGNQEITANILNPILRSIVNALNDKMGDLENLNTDDKSSLVAAINELFQLVDENSGVVIHQGSNNPNQTPPSTYDVTDYYLQTVTGNTTLWQYNSNEWIRLEGQNNIVRLLYADIDFSAENLDEELVDFINDNGIQVEDNEILKFFAQEPVTIGGEVTYYTHQWDWKRGKGSFGTFYGNSVTTDSIWYSGIVYKNRNATQNINYLGEIGTTPIEEIVNISGPFQLTYGDANIFRTTRDGENYDYIYTGEEELIGLGEYQTDNDEYIEVGPDPSPENPNQFVTQLQLNTTFYGRLELASIADINETIPGTFGNYLILEVESTPAVYYFAVKTDLLENFTNCKIYLPQYTTNRNKFELGRADQFKDGYTLFLVEDATFSFPSQNYFPFNCWGVTKRKELLIETPAGIEVFQWKPYQRSNYETVQIGDVAVNGFVDQNDFSLAIIFEGNDHTDIDNWKNKQPLT